MRPPWGHTPSRNRHGLGDGLAQPCGAGGGISPTALKRGTLPRVLAAACVALVLAAPASAAGPRFGLFDLDADLAKASHNVYGDVLVVRSAAALARRAPGAILVRCAAGCRLGSGWLAFAKAPRLDSTGLSAATAAPGVRGWSVKLTLTARGRTIWLQTSRAAAAKAKRTGLPVVYAVVIDGAIVALPFSSDVRQEAGTLELPGFTKTGAEKAARLLGA